MVKMKSITLYIIMVSMILFMLFISMATPMVTNSADFSIYNPGWNGCSNLARRTYESGKFIPNLQLESGDDIQVVQRGLTTYRQPPRASALIFLGPERAFTSHEIAFVHNFLDRGGMVLLADDFGSGNTLLRGLKGTSSAFLQFPLLDLSFEKNPHFGVAYNIRGHEITGNTTRVLLNKPAAISPDENATALIYSSRASWLDRNFNGLRDENEPTGEFPLLTVEKYGNGTLILLSDPSVLINSMLGKMDNNALAEDLFGYISRERENVIFSESHRDYNLVYNIVFDMRYPPKTLTLAAAFIAIITTVFIVDPGYKERTARVIRKYIFREKMKGPEDPVTKLLNNHPHWDEHKLKMIRDRFPVHTKQRDDPFERNEE